MRSIKADQRRERETRGGSASLLFFWEALFYARGGVRRARCERIVDNERIPRRIGKVLEDKTKKEENIKQKKKKTHSIRNRASGRCSRWSRRTTSDDQPWLTRQWRTFCMCVYVYMLLREYMFTEWRLWNRVWIFKRKSPWLICFAFCFFSTTRIFAFFQNNPPTVNVVCSCFCWGCFLLEEGGCIQS